MDGYYKENKIPTTREQQVREFREQLVLLASRYSIYATYVTSHDNHDGAGTFLNYDFFVGKEWEEMKDA